MINLVIGSYKLQPTKLHSLVSAIILAKRVARDETFNKRFLHFFSEALHRCWEYFIVQCLRLLDLLLLLSENCSFQGVLSFLSVLHPHKYF